MCFTTADTVGGAHALASVCSWYKAGHAVVMLPEVGRLLRPSKTSSWATILRSVSNQFKASSRLPLPRNQQLKCRCVHVASRANFVRLRRRAADIRLQWPSCSSSGQIVTVPRKAIDGYRSASKQVQRLESPQLPFQVNRMSDC